LLANGKEIPSSPTNEAPKVFPVLTYILANDLKSFNNNRGIGIHA
jgi:hypothetical protein